MDAKDQTDLREKGPEEGSRVSRNWIIWVVIFGGIVLLMVFRERMDAEPPTISQAQFLQLVNSHQIQRATIVYHRDSFLNEIRGRYYREENGRTLEVPFSAKVRLTADLEEELLSSGKFEPRQDNDVFMSIIWSVLPIIIIAVLIWFFFIRQIRRISRNSPSTVDLQAKQSEQQARFDKILDKWEAQAGRMDGILNKLDGK